MKWVDFKKADDMHGYSLVAKDINTYEAPALWAATPPVEDL